MKLKDKLAHEYIIENLPDVLAWDNYDQIWVAGFEKAKEMLRELHDELLGQPMHRAWEKFTDALENLGDEEV